VHLTAIAKKAFEGLESFVRPFLRKIKVIADWFGPHDVRYLERIATAQYVKRQHPFDEAYGLAAKLRILKPHISEADAVAAVHHLNEKAGALRGTAGRRAS
jgi:hypothetical protein